MSPLWWRSGPASLRTIRQPLGGGRRAPALGHRSPPFTLAYVDIDEGPRVLATLRGPLPDDDRVVIVGSDEGDIVVEAAR
ncbi:MAG: OB-fold domain-containing protein [Acidimicrobiales bacterium]